MHHSETRIPGTFAAMSLIVVAGLILGALLIGGLYGLSSAFRWFGLMG